MGRPLLNADGRLRAVPLAAVSVLGRHWSCHARIRDLAVPMSWLDVRWRGEHGWCWRALGEPDATFGAGELLEGGWRAMTTRNGRGSRVRGPGDTWVELTDPSPPGLLVSDLHGSDILEGADAEELLEVRADGVFDPAVESSSPLRDGDVVLRGGRAWRAHLPTLPVDTARFRMDIAAPECVLDVEREGLTATFTTSRGSVRVRGECVRVLLVYARAREAEPADDGWLSSAEAHAEWVGLGGNPESVVERLSWERGKLRSALSRAGAFGVDALFERRTWAGTPEFRLAMEGRRVKVG